MPTFRAGFALPLDELREEFDRFWSTLTAAPPLHGWGVRPEAAFPAVNVRESADAVVVEAELPGLDSSDVEISVTGDELVLKGARRGGEAAEPTEPSDGGVDSASPSRPSTARRSHSPGRSSFSSCSGIFPVNATRSIGNFSGRKWPLKK